MSLYDLQKKVNNDGAKAFVDQHDKIMREAGQHKEILAKQSEMKMAKDMKTIAKAAKSMKGGLGK